MSDTPVIGYGDTPIGDQVPDPLNAGQLANLLKAGHNLEDYYNGCREVILRVNKGESPDLQQLRWLVDGFGKLEFVVSLIEDVKADIESN